MYYKEQTPVQKKEVKAKIEMIKNKIDNLRKDTRQPKTLSKEEREMMIEEIEKN